LTDFADLDEETLEALHNRVRLYEERLRQQIAEGLDKAARRDAEAQAIAKEKQAEELKKNRRTLAWQNLHAIDLGAISHETDKRKLLENGLAEKHPDVINLGKKLKVLENQALEFIEDLRSSQEDLNSLQKSAKSDLLKSILKEEAVEARTKSVEASLEAKREMIEKAEALENFIQNDRVLFELEARLADKLRFFLAPPWEAAS